MFAKKVLWIATFVLTAILLVAGSAQATLINWAASATPMSNDGIVANAYAQLITGTELSGQYVYVSTNESSSGTPAVLGDTRGTSFTRVTDPGQAYGTGPFNTGDTTLNGVLATGHQAAFDQGSTRDAFTVTGLTLGQAVTLQIFYSTDQYGGTWERFSGDGGANYSNAYVVNQTQAWFTTGTFTATGPTQVIRINGGRNIWMAYLATTPVPEPSTIVLLGMGLLGLLAYAWRKRK